MNINQYICPISREFMTEAVVLSDGTHYDLKSIVPWLLQRRVSPLTNLPVSCRLTRADALTREIREYLKSRNIPLPVTRLDTFIEEEPFKEWLNEKEMGKVEWCEYLVLRRLYWLLKTRESPIPENERMYIQYNSPRDGLASWHTELPSCLEQFTKTCPNAFTTRWVVVHFCDIKSLVFYAYQETSEIRKYLKELPIGRFQYRMESIRITYAEACQWLRMKWQKYTKWRSAIAGILLLGAQYSFMGSIIFVLFCLLYVTAYAVYWIASCVVAYAWLFSLIGYPFWIAVVVMFVTFFILARTKEYWDF